MSRAEKFISDCTSNCSNEIAHWDIGGENVKPIYSPWLTPDQARRAVEIAREEMAEKLRVWVKSHNDRDCYTFGYIDKHFDELLKQAMKDET